MMNTSIAVGVLDTSGDINDPAAVEFFRGLTLSWLRYGYREVIYESSSIDTLVTMAIEAQARYGLILPYGTIVSEQWCEDDVAETDFFVPCFDGASRTNSTSWMNFQTASGPVASSWT